MALRSVTNMTGGLHEVQVRQLKIWPMVLFQDATSSTCAIQTGDATSIDGNPTARFTVHCPAKRGRKSILTDKEATSLLQTFVRRMLGEEWQVGVEVVRGK